MGSVSLRLRLSESLGILSLSVCLSKIMLLNVVALLTLMLQFRAVSKRISVLYSVGVWFSVRLGGRVLNKVTMKWKYDKSLLPCCDVHPSETIFCI